MKKLLLTSAFTFVGAFAFQCLAWTGDGRMDYYCSGQSYEDDGSNWNWGDASYMAFNKGFGHPYGFEAYDNSGVKRGEARVADNNEDYLPIVYGAQVRAFADLNQDGAVDFLMWDCDQHGWGTYKKYTPWGDTNNQVFINNGNGTQFSQINGFPNNIANNKHGDWGCSLPGKYHRLSIADVNGDGYPDILLNGYHDAITGADGKSIDGGWELVIMTNDGKGNFSVAYHSNDYSKNEDGGKETAIHVLDYDQDGKMDILLSGTTNSNSFATPTAVTARWLSYSATSQTVPM